MQDRFSEIAVRIYFLYSTVFAQLRQCSFIDLFCNYRKSEFWNAFILQSVYNNKATNWFTWTISCIVFNARCLNGFIWHLSFLICRLIWGFVCTLLITNRTQKLSRMTWNYQNWIPRYKTPFAVSNNLGKGRWRRWSRRRRVPQRFLRDCKWNQNGNGDNQKKH